MAKVATRAGRGGVAERPNIRDAVREESRATYREAILTAAERAFGRLGFHDAKMADIAAEAGVAAGTVYNYFKNKDEVFASILQRGQERVRAHQEGHADIADPIERTRLRLRDTLAYLEEHGVLFGIFIRLGGFTDFFQKRALEDQCEHSYTHGVNRTQEVIREGVSRGQLRGDIAIEDLTALLMGLCDATIFSWSRAGCPPGLAARADTIIELFLRGAQAP